VLLVIYYCCSLIIAPHRFLQVRGNYIRCILWYIVCCCFPHQKLILAKFVICSTNFVDRRREVCYLFGILFHLLSDHPLLSRDVLEVLHYLKMKRYHSIYKCSVCKPHLTTSFGFNEYIKKICFKLGN